MKTQLICLALLGALGSPCLRAQSDTGHITGTVTDSANAVLPNANVTVKDERTGLSRKAATNDAGAYMVTDLQASTYTVIAEAANMAAREFRGVVLQVGQGRTLNIVVQPATVATEVTVSSGELTAVETSSATVGGNVSEREVAELPING